MAFFKHARDAVVVLGGGDEQRVSVGDGVLEGRGGPGSPCAAMSEL